MQNLLRTGATVGISKRVHCGSPSSRAPLDCGFHSARGTGVSAVSCSDSQGAVRTARRIQSNQARFSEFLIKGYWKSRVLRHDAASKGEVTQITEELAAPIFGVWRVQDIFLGSPDPKDGAANLSQKPVTIYTSIWRHISPALNQHRHENFRIAQNGLQQLLRIATHGEQKTR